MLVKRDVKTGLPVVRSDGKPDIQHAEVPTTLSPRGVSSTWRSMLRKLTKNGAALDEVLYNLAMGNAYESSLPDGRKSEPIVPSPEVRRAAAIDLLHMLRGKPVSQTEVVASERAAEDLAAYAAYSDEDIARAAAPFLERVNSGTGLALAGEEEPEE